MFTKTKNSLTSVVTGVWIHLLSDLFFHSANMDVEKLTFADLNIGRERVTPSSAYAGFLWIPQYILDYFAVVCRLSVLPPPVESSSLGVITS